MSFRAVSLDFLDPGAAVPNRLRRLRTFHRYRVGPASERVEYSGDVRMPNTTSEVEIVREAEGGEVSFKSLDNDPDLHGQYQAWSKQRTRFNDRLFRRDPEAVKAALYHNLGDLPEPKSTHKFC